MYELGENKTRAGMISAAWTRDGSSSCGYATDLVPSVTVDEAALDAAVKVAESGLFDRPTGVRRNILANAIRAYLDAAK